MKLYRPFKLIKFNYVQICDKETSFNFLFEIIKDWEYLFVKAFEAIEGDNPSSYVRHTPFIMARYGTHERAGMDCHALEVARFRAGE